ncbi:VOC family protein [Georgenia sp. 10Sc9-8]|uniref:VOC family protein n=1 Tax=Georgenia halotolerans TaxID=3028317 RepID=A0ABT5TXH8_9MICO|nr:VOC family protein [Georgenia halotolerans]
MTGDQTDKVTPFLMFQGRAEEAMTFYTSLLEGDEIVHISRYGPQEAGREGSVEHAVFTLGGRAVMCIDSTVEHDFGFTPAMSLYLRCDSEAEIEHLYTDLSQEGQVLMPLASYDFSRQFAWVNDRFGVSWQLDLRDEAPGRA